MDDKDRQILDEIKAKLPKYLQDHGLPTNKRFRCVLPTHEDRNPSMSYNPKSNTVHCFGCGATMSVIDLIALDKGMQVDAKGNPQDTRGAINAAKAYFGYPTGKSSVDSLNSIQAGFTEPIHPPTEKVQSQDWMRAAEQDAEQAQREEEIRQSIKEARRHVDDTEYLHKRGLNDFTIEHFKIGYDPEWTNPNGNNSIVSSRVIIPTNDQNYLARATEPDAATPKIKVGKGSPLFNADALTGSKPVFIVEGQFDAMSIFQTGVADAVALCSTANRQALIDRLKQLRMQQKAPRVVYLSMDNDATGQAATVFLKGQLNAIKQPFYVVNPAKGHKDCNAALQADAKAFTKQVYQAVTYPDDRVQKFLDFVQKRENAPIVKTGFTSLDAVLNGGLRTGLYCIGAASSLGKTTFALQIADNMATNNQDVLYFCLEMSEFEMMSKTLSRLTFNHLYDKKAGYNAATDAWSNTEILAGHWSDAGTKRRENLQRAIAEYKEDTAPHIRFIDANEMDGRPDIKTIEKAVGSYIERTGKKPVVVIDYLQILSPLDAKMTDKQAVTNSVVGMKRISTVYDVPVITISSFNRASYKVQVGMQSFKESGDIEYSADVLIGMQFAGLSDKISKDAENDHDARILEYKARSKDPREIELYILKNRNGRIPKDPVAFNYKTKFNVYSENNIVNMLSKDSHDKKPKYQVDADKYEIKRNDKQSDNEFLSSDDIVTGPKDKQ